MEFQIECMVYKDYSNQCVDLAMTQLKSQLMKYIQAEVEKKDSLKPEIYRMTLTVK